MDDIVRQAIAKWPNVPNCYGWLGLDARGGWYMRDDRVQAAGAFVGGGPESRGSLLKHDKLIEFIHRNYESDQHGCWFFQNGPQRVYVELEVAPFVWRVEADLSVTAETGHFSVTAHTGRVARPQRCLLDDLGRVFIEADLGFGLVHTLDVGVAAEAVEQGLWVPQQVLASALPKLFGYVSSPQQQFLARDTSA